MVVDQAPMIKDEALMDFVSNLIHWRKCVDMNVASRMFLEDFHSALLVCCIPCPDP
jgi:hypothetical protein